MATDISKLAAVQSAIDSLASGETDLSTINPRALTKQTKSVTDNISPCEIKKIADTQRKITEVLGSSIDLGGIAKIADCVKNIDDLLMEKVKSKAIEAALKNDSIANIVSNIDKVKNIVETAKGLMDGTKSLKEKSLSDLLVDAKNAGLLDRVAIFKKITEKYGSAVSNINEIIDNIANIDICSQVDYKVGFSGPMPPPTKINTAPPQPLPQFAPSVQVDMSSVEAKQKYDDALFRISDAIGDKASIENNGPNLSMLTELQGFGRILVNRYSESDESANESIDIEMSNEIARKVDMYKLSWPPATLREYLTRANAAKNSAAKDANDLRNFVKLRQLGQNISGQLMASGVTIYGGPDWDLTTFLDIKPAQRTSELTAYWQGRGINIESQTAKLNARGIRTGTLNFSDAYKGAYGDSLIAGQSCASTRFPGGTKLLLKNPDGSIYDPAGINPSGIVTVQDTGNAELTFKKVDLFISREHVPFYKKTNMNAIQVFLVSMGTKTGKQYNLAQSKFANKTSTIVV